MLRPGMTVNHGTIVIENEIGSGGGGCVFKAYHKNLQKYVAVKLIRENVKNILDVRAEVDILKNLKHSYLPTIMDFIEEDGNAYTVMEFIEGQNVDKYITGGHPLTEAEVVRYMLELCEAVEYLHSKKPPIIHSDIKPANIMLTNEGHICLLDFNISTVQTGGKAVSHGGSRNYAAPEQFKRVISVPSSVGDFQEATRFIHGSGEEARGTASKNSESAQAFVDIRSDIYGMGATMYFMLCRRVPKNGSVNTDGSGVTKALMKIVAKAADPDPAKRYRNVAEMKSDLQAASSKARDTVANFIPSKLAAAGTKPLRMAAIISATVSLTAIVCAVVVFVMSSSDEISVDTDTQTSTSAETTTEAETAASTETQASAVVGHSLVSETDTETGTAAADAPDASDEKLSDKKAGLFDKLSGNAKETTAEVTSSSEAKKAVETVINFPNGDKYEGEAVDDIPNGEGKYYTAGGDRYEGTFTDGKLNGYGFAYFSSGDKYTGNFENSLMSDGGIYEWVSGNKYVGKFKDGWISGLGTMYYDNGSKYVGDFVQYEKDGTSYCKREGTGSFYWTNGDHYEGDFKNDEIGGKGTMYYADGTRYEGDFAQYEEDGKMYFKREGTGTLYNTDGSVYFAGEFKDGLPVQ